MIPHHRLIVLAVPLVCAGPAARAHHGQDLLVVQDAAVPGLWSGSAFGSYEWSEYGADHELSAEPGFMVGIAPGMAVGTSVSFFDIGEGWRYTSVTPSLQVQLTPAHWPVRVSLLAGYEFADESVQPTAPVVYTTMPAARTITRQVKETAAPPPEPPPDPGPCGPEYGPDAPPCPESTAAMPAQRHVGPIRPAPDPVPTRIVERHFGHTPTAPATTTRSITTTTSRPGKRVPVPPPPAPPEGIHRHGEDHFFTRLIVEADVTAADKLIVNLIAISPREGRPAWGYAGAGRHAFSHKWAIGAEAIGDFGKANEHELILGAYWTPVHTTTLKLGLGTGLTSESADLSLRSGLVWRF